MQPHPGDLDTLGKIAQRFMKLFFAGNLFGHVELAADFARGIKQINFMPACGEFGRAGEPGWPGTDHGDALFLDGFGKHQFCFMTRPRIDQARCEFLLKHMIKTRLIAADAGVDFIGAALSRFVDKLRIGQ